MNITKSNLPVGYVGNLTGICEDLTTIVIKGGEVREKFLELGLNSRIICLLGHFLDFIH